MHAPTVRDDLRDEVDQFGDMARMHRLFRREIAHARLFKQAKWLRDAIVTQIVGYASGLQIDNSRLESLADPSAMGDVDERVKGLRAGGDDYLPKPYSFSELLARIEVLARRHGGRGLGADALSSRTRRRPALPRPRGHRSRLSGRRPPGRGENAGRYGPRC